MCDRVVALVDMDCFYCQVEARLNPSLKGKPLAVVQYNPWQGGGIIAVNYEARKFGVSRHIRGNEAKEKCPDIALVQVPEVRGKPDLTRYREAGREVVEVLCEFCDCVEKASVDEAYLDLTKTVEKRMLSLNGTAVTPAMLANTFVVGFTAENTNDEEERKLGMFSWLESVYQNELSDKATERLAVAGLIVEEMRAAIYSKTGFQCSAGIAHNKILAKLACGIHKPNRQTILPHTSVTQLYQTLPVKKIRSLGGKFGDAVVEQLGCKVVADLLRFTESQLQQMFDEKSGSWLYNIARGFDYEPVTPRLMSKSVGCCKKFPGKQSLSTREDVEKWLLNLATEVSERLLKELASNKRRATTLTVAYQQNVGGRTVSSSRCGSLNSYEPQQIAQDAYELIKKNNSSNSSDSIWNPPLKFLGLSAGKFLEKSAIQTSTMRSFFKSASKVPEQVLENNVNREGEDKLQQLSEQEPRVTLDDLFRSVHNGEKKISGSLLENESFFVKYFKSKALSPNLQNSSQLNCQKSHVSNDSSAGHRTNNKIFSNLKEREEKNISSSSCKNENFISSDPVPSTSHVSVLEQDQSISGLSEDSNGNMPWISLQEIFPDLNDVDDDVVALLPSPMQRKLVSRMENHKKNKEIAQISEDSDGDDLSSQSNKTCSKSTVENFVLKERILAEHSDTKVIYKPKCKSSENSEEIFVSVDAGVSNNTTKSCDPNASVSVSPIKKAKMTDVNNTVTGCGTSQNSDLHVLDSTDDNSAALDRETSIVQLGNSVAEQDLSQTFSGSKNSETGELSSHHFEDLLDESNIESEICPHCHEVISLLEYPEHLDFHIAKELDKELNFTAPSVSRTVAKDVPTTVKKRGRTSKKQNTSVADKKIRSITNFFTPIK
ncbi:DNA polymerase eta [Anabrus simplex]|uniref:DNA polymerase eta n=1 Tax=Anabrus simplex TaxID=316456 RepID=UPI0035A2C59D